MLENALETVIELERNEKWQEAHVSSHICCQISKASILVLVNLESGDALQAEVKAVSSKKIFLALIYRITVTRPSKFPCRLWQAWHWEMHSKPK